MLNLNFKMNNTIYSLHLANTPKPPNHVPSWVIQKKHNHISDITTIDQIAIPAQIASMTNRRDKISTPKMGDLAYAITFHVLMMATSVHSISAKLTDAHPIANGFA